MRKEIEDILFEYLLSALPEAMKPMLVKGHSTEDRHIPYISLNVGDVKPFSDMLESDGIFESEVNVAIADSAHDINYDTQFLRITEVRSILGNLHWRTRSIVAKDYALRRRTTPETIIIWVYS